MTRTFIALELDEALQRHLRETIRQVAAELPRFSWVNPSGIHLTLAFLGELSDEQLLQASQAAEVAAQHGAPFDYRLSHLGIFGSPRQPRVLWVGIEETSGRLQNCKPKSNNASSVFCIHHSLPLPLPCLMYNR